MYGRLRPFLDDPAVRAWLFNRDTAQIRRDARSAPRRFTDGPSFFSQTFASANIDAAYRGDRAERHQSLIVPFTRTDRFVLADVFSNMQTCFGFVAKADKSTANNNNGNDDTATNQNGYVYRLVVDSRSEEEISGLEFAWLTDSDVIVSAIHVRAHGKLYVETYLLHMQSDSLPPLVKSITIVEDTGKCVFCVQRQTPCICPASFRNRTDLATVTTTNNFADFTMQYAHFRNDVFSEMKFAYYTGRALAIPREYGQASELSELCVTAENGERVAVTPSAQGQIFGRQFVSINRTGETSEDLRRQLEMIFGSSSSPMVDRVLRSSDDENDSVDSSEDDDNEGGGSGSGARNVNPLSIARTNIANALVRDGPDRNEGLLQASIPPRPQLTCEICGTSLSTNASMRRHIRIVHEKKRSVQCQYCDYSCYQRSDYGRHLRRRHPREMKDARNNVQDNEDPR